MQAGSLGQQVLQFHSKPQGKHEELPTTSVISILRTELNIGRLTHILILDIEQRITSLQSTPPGNLGNKEDPKRDIHGPPEKRKKTRYPEQSGSICGEEGSMCGEEREGEKRRGKEDMSDQED
ncbi:hypothetical protein H671_2g7211 [Cricetulus griseus]|nr:hypothetical protein H671_2g7211 [Cricetulus griseus]